MVLDRMGQRELVKDVERLFLLFLINTQCPKRPVRRRRRGEELVLDPVNGVKAVIGPKVVAIYGFRVAYSVPRRCFNEMLKTIESQ